MDSNPIIKEIRMNWILIALIACSQENTQNAPAVPADVPVEKKEQVDPAAFEQYGQEFSIAESIPASKLMSNPEEYVGKKVRVSGTVSDVCQKMGCWMVITEDDKHMRVTTKEHKFFVAKDGSGSQCDIEGEVIKKEADKDRTEHFASEKSDGAPVPEGEVNNSATYEIVAEAIRFEFEDTPQK